MFGRILQLAWKETRHIVRDFRTLWMALGIPLVLLLLFGYALTMDVEDIALIVVDSDHTPLSRELSGAFERSGYFTVVERPDNEKTVLQRFRRYEAKAALIIPHGFERDAERGNTARAQLIVDGADANVADITIGYAQAIEQMLSFRMIVNTLERNGLSGGGMKGAPFSIKSRNWFNPSLNSQWFMVPGLIALIMSMMTSILMALTVAKEWENGTMEQLLVTPVNGMEIAIGKIIPYFVIGLGQLLLIAVSGILLFKVPLRGNIGALLLISVVFLLGGLAWGLLISIITRQQQLAMQMAILTSMLPSLILSGFMTPIASMPSIVQAITYIFPARYYLVALRGLFLKDLPLSALQPELTALLIYLVVILLLCSLRFKTEVA